MSALRLTGACLLISVIGLSALSVPAHSMVWSASLIAALSAQPAPPGGAPTVIGSQVAGTFADASGHSGQSHLFYAVNSGVWWLLTLSSAADSQGGTNHLVKAYYSSGPDLATATWTAAANSPGAAASQSSNCPNCFMGGGRALGVAYLNNAPTDAVHAEVALAFDGQNGLTAHMRATVTATSIRWETWGYYDAPAATWALPRGVALGVSTGKHIHSGGPTLQQEVDANVRVSNNPDLGATWTTGFSSVSLIDNSMAHQCNSMTLAPLANNRMLAVYDNGGGQAPCFNCEGGVPEPNLSNLGYKRSNANGSWPTLPVGGQAAGDGQVFSTDATIDQNDWAVVSRDTTTIHAFRRRAAGNGIDAAAYNAVTNTWAAFPSPPLFGTGQSHKAGSGVFGVADGGGLRLFVISNNGANSILQTRFDGVAWSGWAVVPGTDSGLHVRRFLSGSRVSGPDQIGLIWTEGTTQFDVFTTSIRLGWTVPDLVGLTQAVATTRLTSAGLSVGTLTTASSATVVGGSVISQQPAAGTTVSAGSAVDMVIALATVPDVVTFTQAAAATAISGAGLTSGSVGTASSAAVPIGTVISQSPPALSEVVAGSPVDLVVSNGVGVPNVQGQTQAAAVTTIAGVAGLSLGTITNASSSSVAVGLVISQSPAGATRVSGGSFVDLVVSSGPPTGGVTLASMVLTPFTVTGGASSLGTVTLSGAATGGGVVVSLSDNSAAAATPASVTLPAGATNATFTVTTTAVTASTSVTVSAVHNGVTRTAALTVNAPTTPAAPSLVSPANAATVAQPVTLDWNDVTGATSYEVQVDNSSTIVSPFIANPTVTVSQATLSGLPAQQLWWRVRAQNAAGVFGPFSTTRRFTAQAAPPAVTLSSVAVSPASVVGGTGSTGTVALTSGAPTGGVMVSLSSSNNSVATVPASVTILQGSTSATFAIATSGVSMSTPVTITASTGTVTRTATLTVTPPAQNATLTVTATGRSGVRVTSSPAGINVNVGSSGSAPFSTGAVITLSVTSGRDAIWSGACSSGGNKRETCTFTLTGNASVSANVQ